MQKNEVCFTQDIYSEHLATINGITFTPREIDIIACLLSARGTSKIASFLSIAPRTVATHIRNIMLKLECNSRERIIDFVEKTGTLPILREYYARLIIELALGKSLHEISKLRHEEKFSCLVVYWCDQNLKNTLLLYLKTHLIQAGIVAEVRDQSLDQSIEKIKDTNSFFLLLVEKKNQEKLPEEFLNLDFIDIADQQNYYFSIFEILKKILPNANFEMILANFKDQYERMNLSIGPVTLKSCKNEYLDNNKKFSRKVIQILVLRKWHLIFSFFIITVLSVVFLIIKSENEDTQTSVHAWEIPDKKESVIRSDLAVPTKSSLLERPELISQIDEKFKKQDGIQTVALVGPGGAGKTTLARQYVSQQKTYIIQEVNAETHETLRSSFENLAQAFAQTEEDKKILREFEDIKPLEERDGKIIQFVKERLYAHPNWILIYDNVEKFSEIQKYFPQDFTTWGQGKVIFTTRDESIQNNKYVNSVVYVRELSPDQKLNLFTKIVHQDKRYLFKQNQIEEIKAFLEKIPPFPLDISIASYYLKATNIKYNKYLEYLTKYSDDFVAMQENILKEAGDYTKTRHGIITLSVQQLLTTHNDFKDLLLFISLLDSQNIPSNLLKTHKNEIVVDNFIYNLKKYSLITNDTTPLLDNETFSIHRSTQIIILSHLIKLLNLKIDKKPLNSIFNTLENYTIDAIERDEFSTIKLLANHYMVLLSHSIITNNVKNYIKSEIGIINYYTGDNIKSKKFLEESLTDLNDYDKQSQNRTAWILGFLGIINGDLGAYTSAKNLLEKSLIIYQKNPTKNYEKIARFLIYLGIINKRLGNYEKAIHLMGQSVNTYKKYFPKNHIKLAWASTYLGSVYRNLGYYEKAKSLFEQSVIIYKKNYGETHINTAWALANLGILHNELENYEQAKSLMESSLNIYREFFPETSMYIAWLLEYLGSVYANLGEYKTAKSVLEKSLTAYKNNRGENNIETARVLRTLGQAYLLEGQLETSEDLVNRALKVFQQSNHPESYVCFITLSDLYRTKRIQAKNKADVQQFQTYEKKSFAYLMQAKKIIEEHFPKDSPHLKRIQEKIKTLEEG